MGSKFPSTIITDKAFSMAAAIELVFPGVQHRLCHFHIIKSSRKHIRALRGNEGFIKLFNKVLIDCHRKPEFEYFWKR